MWSGFLSGDRSQFLYKVLAISVLLLGQSSLGRAASPEDNIAPSRSERFAKAREETFRRTHEQEKALSEILGRLEAWYVYPEDRRRHRIHGVWGPTGTGKTSSILKLLEDLGLEKSAVLIDLQKFAENTGHEATIASLGQFHEMGIVDQILTKVISSEYLSIDFKMEGVSLELDQELTIPKFEVPEDLVIILDEFQYAATIDFTGRTLNRERIQPLWEILGNGGKVRILNPRVRALRELIENIRHFVQVEFDTDIETEVKKEWLASKKHLKSDDTLMELDQEGEEIPSGIFNEIALDKEITLRQLQRRQEVFRKLGSWLNEKIAKEPAEIEIDLSKSFFFVLGNLNSLFRGSSRIGASPSYADEFHKKAKEITPQQIRQALGRMFTPKDLARIGSNHSIFLPFSRSGYTRAIQSEFQIVINRMKEMGIDLKISDRLYERFFEETVDPTQGYRQILDGLPVFLEDPLTQIIYEIRTQTSLDPRTPVSVEVDLSKDQMASTWRFLENDFRFPIPSRAIERSKPYSTEVAERVALYIAAKTTGYIAFRAEIPRQVFSKVDFGVGGFVDADDLSSEQENVLSGNELLEEIAVLLSGYALEQIIYVKADEEKSFGATALSISDLETATGLANWSAGSFHFQDYLASTDIDRRSLSGSIDLIMERGQSLATEVVIREQNFIRELARVLTEKTQVSAEEIAKIKEATWQGGLKQSSSCREQVAQFMSGKMRLANKTNGIGFSPR